MEPCSFVRPDLTVLLDLDAAAAGRRLNLRGGADRIEAAGGSFMARVAEGYRELARREPGRFAVVDAGGTEDEVADRVEAAVEARLEGIVA